VVAAEAAAARAEVDWEEAVMAACPQAQLLLWCYGSRGIAAHNMLWVVMGVMGPAP